MKRPQGLRNDGCGGGADLGERGIVNRIPEFAPRIQPTLQRPDPTYPPISQQERRTGARSFVWSSAIEDDFAVVRQPVVLLQFLGIHSKSTRDGFGVRFEIQFVS